MILPPGLTAFLTLGLLTRHAVATPSPTARDNSPISWGDCEAFGGNSTNPNFQCGYLGVPMDYHDSSAGTARLAVIKYAATVKKLGTIFFNPGGPGDSGIEFLQLFGETFNEIFRGTYDIVSWDPRGVGYTFPGNVYIFNNTEEETTFWNNTIFVSINETISGKFDQQDTEELYSQVDPTEAKYQEFNERCINSPPGPYLKYIGTSSTIRDLVSLGDAIVGQGEPIDYWGASYGTVIGFNFLNMFPERAGHIILDGVVDPTTWTTYKYPRSSLIDAEKTYSGLADGCAAAGRAGCKLVEITGDGAGGDDVMNLINDAFDAALELYRAGYGILANPGPLKVWLYTVLYAPERWSSNVNGLLYAYVALVLQTAQTHNITIPGGRKYQVPSGNITFGDLTGSTSANQTSYSLLAISGADRFKDDNTTIKDIFDMIVETTRAVSPTFGTIWGLGFDSYKFPVRSVEQLPPYSPKQLKYPVLVIGNSADPATPFVNAQKAAGLLGNNTFLLEQLGFGHSSLAQVSTCTWDIIGNYVANSTLPQGSSGQCAINDTDIFPALNGTETGSKRAVPLRRRL